MSFIPELAGLFLLGLLSSVSHCVGMCGGFVYCYSSRYSNQAGSVVAPHLLYNSGRILTYGFLGMLFGWLTQTTRQYPQFLAAQSLIQLFAALVMMALALSMLGVVKINSKWFEPVDKLFVRMAAKTMQDSRTPLFVLGMVLGGIPCGLVYAAGLKAAATADPFKGALCMLSFGLGTWPAMIFLGWGSSRLNLTKRTGLYRLSAVVVLIMAFMTMRASISGLLSPSATVHEHHHHDHHQ